MIDFQALNIDLSKIKTAALMMDFPVILIHSMTWWPQTVTHEGEQHEGDMSGNKKDEVLVTFWSKKKKERQTEVLQAFV